MASGCAHGRVVSILFIDVGPISTILGLGPGLHKSRENKLAAHACGELAVGSFCHLGFLEIVDCDLEP